jgi:CRP-like cAMP-binding protein
VRRLYPTFHDAREPLCSACVRLADIKMQALLAVVQGDLARALRLYESAVIALPQDLDARMKIADLCVSALQHDLARRVYAAVAFYDLQAGRPLHCVVVCQALRSLGDQVGPIHESLAQLFGAGSPRIARGGARLSPPDPETDVPVLELAAGTTLEQAAQSAARAASSTTDLPDLPQSFPPVPLLSELSPESFARVLDTVRIKRLPHGAPVVREGEPGDAFFLVAAGAVRVFTTDALGTHTELARLGEGAVFGELALVAAQPRLASVSVQGEADLLEMGADALRAASGELQQLAEALSRFTRDRLIKNLLAASPLFRPFSPQQRIDLARRFTGHDVQPGTDIIREGDAGRGLYVVLAGEVEVLKGEAPFETTLATLRSGDVFGEIALVRGTPATATVRAARPATVLFLAREYFERLVAALPEMRSFFENLTEERLRDAEQQLSGGEIPIEDELILI